ncbi:DUF4853 domain-containing protein [Schaalia sp. Marseille-Q2122]|uniref:DUF4853 domain-containing protein n=1 Tax=Schaalia sp. Marseille-Q2122 TaxID=2736604 RepID=UPI00158A6C98|nr:DUF4853 domain-containing protein [Schaalia sp. Marseille-Q2122]
MSNIRSLTALTLSLLLATTLLTSCTLQSNSGHYEAAGDGDLPLAQRQPIEEYIDTVVPAYGAFMNELANEVGAQLYISENSLMTCVELKRFDVYSANTLIPKALPVERVRHIGDKHFIPLGLDKVSTHSGDGLTSIYWSDLENGGWVAITIGPRLTADAVSGVRPGSLTQDQCVNFTSKWEKHLPMDTVFFDSLQSSAQSSQQSDQAPQSSSPAQSGN